MKIIDVLEKDSIIAELKAEDKREVIEEMIEGIVTRRKGLDKAILLEVLLEREKLGSTGIGYGVAIPHGKLKDLDHLIVAFGRSLKGVDFQSLDNKPVYIFFLILAPEDSTAVHLKILARISRLLKDASFRRHLMEVSTSDDLFAVIAEEDKKF
ncbi:MAG: PTS sugar transporter subunit IIA [Thermodesulfobacteriota bacterium]